MKPTKVFIPVSVERLPENNDTYFTHCKFYDAVDGADEQDRHLNYSPDLKKWWDVDSESGEDLEMTPYVTHWLEEQADKFLFSKEELEKLLEDAFDKARLISVKEQFIQQIIEHPNLLTK